jgi:hypothetical protein
MNRSARLVGLLAARLTGDRYDRSAVLLMSSLITWCSRSSAFTGCTATSRWAIGLGITGGSMATNLVAAGYNRSRGKVDRIEAGPVPAHRRA